MSGGARGERSAHQPAGAGRGGAGGAGRCGGLGAVRGARGGSAGRCGGRGAPPGCSARRARGQRRAAHPRLAGGSARLRGAAAPWRRWTRSAELRGVRCGAGGGGRCGAERGADPFSLPAARLRGDFPRGEGAARLPQGARVGESRVGRDGEQGGGVAVVVVVGSGGVSPR